MKGFLKWFGDAFAHAMGAVDAEEKSHLPPPIGEGVVYRPNPDHSVARPGLAGRRAMTTQCWTIMGGGRICTEDISKKKTLLHLYLAKVLPKVKKES